MIHNKEGIIPGDVVRLDKGRVNSSLVVVAALTPHGMYSRVYPSEIENPKDDDHWEVMTSRLTKELAGQVRINMDKITEWGSYYNWKDKNLNVLSMDYDKLLELMNPESWTFEEYCLDRWSDMP